MNFFSTDRIYKYRYILVFFLLFLIFLINFIFSKYLFFLKILLNIIISFLIFYFIKHNLLCRKILLLFNNSKLELSNISWPSINKVITITFFVVFLGFLYSFIVCFLDKIILIFISNLIRWRL